MASGPRLALHKFDLAGAVLLVAGLVLTLLAFTSIQQGGRAAAALLVVGLGVLAALVVVFGAFPAPGAAIVARVLGALAPRWSQPAAAVYARFCQGLGVPMLEARTISQTIA